MDVGLQRRLRLVFELCAIDVADVDLVARGLERRPRVLDCRWLYDAEGSAIFIRVSGL